MRLDNIEEWLQSESCMKILCLKAAIIVLPVLNCVVDAPIGFLFAKKSDAYKVLEILNPYVKSFPTLSMSKNELQRLYAHAEYESFSVVFKEGKTTQGKVQMIESMNASEKCKCVPIIFFENLIPRDVSFNLCGMVAFDELTKETDLMVEENDNLTSCIIQIAQRYQCNLMKKLDKIEESIEMESHEKMFFVAKLIIAHFFEELGLCDEDRTKSMNLLEKVVEKIIMNWDCISLTDDMLEKQFVKSLFDYVSKVNYIVDREAVSSEEITCLEDAIWYDDKFYYLPNAIFCEISRVFGETISQVVLKQILAHTGLLVVEGIARNYFTIKVTAVTVYGISNPFRKIKIRRDKIDQIGRLAWKDIILSGRRTKCLQIP